ncbi:MAG: hypothetical protein Edafosvirus2_24 [Edafosvirus sp.]|uniref:Uncharacterized protein n=1 Tax=Edafosvirus sp. TaxID=2487765 RepID=A0A3G4ZSH9_9VIRU|nr:MAG: hypothetical protein Edafosvirus2_24 [Edafosvirus sp.]
MKPTIGGIMRGPGMDPRRILKLICSYTQYNPIAITK